MTTIISVAKAYISQKRRTRLFKPEDEESVEGKIIIVTGANCGIGKETAKALVTRGAIVIMVCRNEEKAKVAIEDINIKLGEKNLKGQMIFMKLDLEELNSVRSFAQEFKSKYNKCNILILNAGVSDQNGVLLKTKDGNERHMGVNHLAHFLLTSLLLDELKAGVPSRVIAVSSLLYAYAQLNPDDLMLEKTPHGFLNLIPYANSKLANILFIKELANRVKDTGISTYALCPGLVNDTSILRTQGWLKRIPTKLLWNIAGINLEQGCRTIIYCALSKTAGNESGKMYQFGKVWKGVAENLDKKLAKILWDKSEEYVGLKNN